MNLIIFGKSSDFMLHFLDDCIKSYQQEIIEKMNSWVFAGITLHIASPPNSPFPYKKQTVTGVVGIFS